jgi:GT2 family glycosyltransferase
MPRLRDDALLSHALQAFEQGDDATALLAAEYVCRHHPEQHIPAILRAKILQRCRPQMAEQAWYHAWSRDPENPMLQDALLQAWLNEGVAANVAELGPAFLPARCRAGQHANLLALLRRAGLGRLAACWKAGAMIEGRVFADPTGPTPPPPAQLLLSSETKHYRYQVPSDGGLFRLMCPTPNGVWSISVLDGDDPSAGRQLLQGSPLAFYPEPAPPAPHPADAAEPRPVCIVIPVYRELALVQACLGSVLASLAHNRTPASIVVVDDASPEPALSAWLDTVAASGVITLLRNRDNLGFIEACNRGMRQQPERDVLLLNADTLVHGDWIDRLAAVLHAAPDVASVTPWSNNGEISSFPRIAVAAPAPDKEQLARLDDTAAALRAAGASGDIELPSCCGFTMLMRRSVLDQIGMLDGAGLIRGYGEEVDWCLRARAAGHRHLMACGVFVGHSGTVSFRFEKKLRVRQNRMVLMARYPDYRSEYQRFLRDDPLAGARHALRTALERDGDSWLQQASPAHTDNAEATFTPPAALSAPVSRVAVWQHIQGEPGTAGVLALARLIASTPQLPLRLLVIGEASEALWHTGVVDVLPSGLGLDAPLLSDAELIGLAGCTSVLSGDAQALPGGIPCTLLERGFDAAAWLNDWLARQTPRAVG